MTHQVYYENSKVDVDHRLHGAAFRLKQNKKRVLHIWKKRVRTSIPAAAKLNSYVLTNSLPNVIDELVKALANPKLDQQEHQQRKLAKEHGEERSEVKGYDLSQIIEEYQVLRKVIFEVLREEKPLSSDETDCIFDAITIGIQDATAEFQYHKQIKDRAYEAELQQSEQRFRSIIEGVSEHAIIRTNAAGTIEDWNSGATQITGWTRDEVLGKQASIIFNPEDLASGADKKELMTAAKTGRASDNRWYIKKDGSHFFAFGVMNPLKDEFGKLTGFVKVFRDFTQTRKEQIKMIKESEQAISSRDEMYQLVMQAPSPIALVSGHDFRFILANPLYEKLAGRPLIGKTVQEAFTEAEVGHYVPLFKKVYETGESYTGSELPIKLSNDQNKIETKFFNLGYHPFRGADGKINGIFNIVQDVTEQVLARKRIEESESHLRHIINAIPNMVWIGKPDGTIEWQSESYNEYTGFNHFAARNKKNTSIHPDDIELTDKTWKQSVKTGKPFNNEHRMRRYDGQYRWHIARARPIKDSRGKIVQWIGSTTDIHDQKVAEAALKESEASFRQLANALPLIVWTSTPHGEVDWYNDWWYQYLNKPQGTTWNDPSNPTMHPDDVEKTNQIWPKTVAAGEPFSMEQRFKRGSDGQYRWHLVRGVPIFDEKGKVTKYVGGNTDIHEQKMLQEELSKAKKELEAKSQLLETVIQQIPMALVYAEAPSGKLIFANAQLKKVWRHDFIQANNIDEYHKYIAFHPDGKRFAGKDWPLARAITTGQIIQGEEIDVQLGDGTRAILRLSAAPVKDSNGKIIGGVVISENVTEQVQAQKVLAASEARYREAKNMADAANTAKSNFLANMSHEIRTPIGVIQGFADLLSERHLEPEEMSWVQTIRRNTRQLTSLIGEILDLSKVEADQLELEHVPFKLIDVVEDLRATMSFKAEEKGLALLVEIDPSLPKVVVSDPTRLRQILINLVGNAIKFTKEGMVRVRFGLTEELDQKLLLVSITDTGIGLTAEQKEKIFEPFVQADSSMTRRFGGTGLGLSISKKLANALGGTLRLVRSEAGVGSTFELTVCCLEEDAEALLLNQRTQSPIQSGINLNGKKILLVEDSPDNQWLIIHMLEQSGAKVSCEANGKLGADRALKEDFDVVLMDIQMPEMDGYGAIKLLRKAGYRKPVIALTAHALKEERERAMSLGFNSYITKPIAKTALYNTIASAIATYKK